LIVTAGLVSYNLRNDQLYNELVGRAANIERSLGVPDGAFANRPAPSLSLRLPFGRVWPMAHDSGVALIYAASITLWLFIVLFSLIQLPYDGDTPSWWARAADLLVAIAIVAGAVSWIAAEKRIRRGAMRAAVGYAVKLASGGFDEAPRSRDFLTLCAGLRDKDVARSSDFWDLLEGLPREDGEPDWLTRRPKPSHKGNLDQARRTVQERAEYYASIKDNAPLGATTGFGHRRRHHHARRTLWASSRTFLRGGSTTSQRNASKVCYSRSRACPAQRVGLGGVERDPEVPVIVELRI
jgi:hypothetical protein